MATLNSAPAGVTAASKRKGRPPKMRAALVPEDSGIQRKSVPAIPRRLSSALKGLEAGSLDLVYVTGVVEAGEREFSVSAGIKHELFDIFYKPFLPAVKPLADGNVILFRRPPTAIEQIIAVGEAFSAGKLSALIMIVRHAGGRVEKNRFK